MITEDYCSFEVSKLLKEKGFNEKVICYYDDGGSLNLNKFAEFQCCNQGYGSSIFAAPTLQMTMKWLREVHNIFIVIEPHLYDYVNERNASYVCSIWVGDNYYENPTSTDFPSYEEACEAAIKYSLENLI